MIGAASYTRRSIHQTYHGRYHLIGFDRTSARDSLQSNKLILQATDLSVHLSPSYIQGWSTSHLTTSTVSDSLPPPIRVEFSPSSIVFDLKAHSTIWLPFHE